MITSNLGREHGWEDLTVEGTLPEGLAGTLYRCGPALFERFGKRYRHPFEGDGGVTAVRLGAGRARGATRIVESQGLAEERAAGRHLYGLLATPEQRRANLAAGRDKNPANTHVIPWQGKLYALWEGGRPTEIDPETLATAGERDLGGAVRRTFSAHPHRVESRRTLYNFGVRYEASGTRLDLYALPDDGPARHLGDVALDAPPMLHDFIATDTHLIVFLSPVRIAVEELFRPDGDLRNLVGWKPELGTEVICIPLAGDGLGEAVRFPVEPFFQWHFANAHGDGQTLVVDYVRYPDFGTFTVIAGGPPASPGILCRSTIDLAARRLTTVPLADGAMEFPRVHPRVEGERHRVVWGARTGDGAALSIDVERGTVRRAALEPGQTASEPVFVPRGAAEDDGWILQLVADERAGRSHLAVLDGRRLEDGPVARAWFDQLIPVTFHGSFV